MRDRRLVAGLALALFGVVLLGLAAFAVLRSGPAGQAPALTEALKAARPAGAPFEGLTAVSVAVGGRCIDAVVADTPEERFRGLRKVRALGPYDGMLFAYQADSTGPFTMSGTPLPLDIVWFSADGSPVDRARMLPCPEGDDLSCPLYEPSGPYRYALETPAGSGTGGTLAACS